MDGASADAVRCSCKGIRSCLICERVQKKPNPVTDESLETVTHVYVFCVQCQTSYLTPCGDHPNHNSPGKPFPGVYIKNEFIDKDTELSLVEKIDKIPWIDSQSGRRKQDFGPKVNFKKQKVKIGNFNGLPDFSKELITSLKSEELLRDFEAVEQCHLEYVPERGSAIDPHFDDFWLWGERLVTLNLVSRTVLRMSCDSEPGVEVHLPLAPRSLLVLFGPARYHWKHAVHRDDVIDRRLAITLRELTPQFLAGGVSETIGSELLKIAENFNGKSIGES